MVYIKLPDGTEKKYACQKCIKGHRSSKCKHTDRELFEIKKKGRPITQCETCRLLRKTQQVHAKCECRVKNKANKKQESIYNNNYTVLDEKHIFPECALNVSRQHMHLDTMPSNTSCLQCDRPKIYCICHNSSSSNSSICSEDTSSPVIVASPIPHTLNTVSGGRHLIIPIHDPSDDIDSDTPIYKPLLEEDATTSSLGQFTSKSSEELMNQIYSGFSHHSCAISVTTAAAVAASAVTATETIAVASPLLEEEDAALVELSRE